MLIKYHCKMQFHKKLIRNKHSKWFLCGCMSTEAERMYQIKKILLEHKGKKNTIKSKKIALMVGIQEDATHGSTRNLITKLSEQGLPIGACSKGYFIIETQAEVDEYRRFLNNRIQEMINRIGWLQSNFDSYYGKNKVK